MISKTHLSQSRHVFEHVTELPCQVPYQSLPCQHVPVSATCSGLPFVGTHAYVCEMPNTPCVSMIERR